MTYQAHITAKNGRVLFKTTAAFETREDAARAVFALAPQSHKECTTYRGHFLDIRWLRRDQVARKSGQAPGCAAQAKTGTDNA